MDASNTIGSTATATATATGAVTAKNQLGKDEFLKLLTAQLANQDPLQPVDNQAFIAQLAQFSSLEQLQGVSSRLDSLLLATTSSTQLGTASLVGKSVSYQADGVTLTDGQPPPALQASLSVPAAVTAQVVDGSGRAVRTLVLGVRPAGSFDLGWDGRDDRGQALPAGHYTVRVAGRAADGSAANVQLRASGRVQGVNLGADGSTLLVGGDEVKLSDVLQITQS